MSLLKDINEARLSAAERKRQGAPTPVPVPKRNHPRSVLDEFGPRAALWGADTIHVVDVSNKRLTSLKGSPPTANVFLAHDNKLATLAAGPVKITGNYDVSNNLLTSLEHAPTEVAGNFAAVNNRLTSLAGCPKQIDGHLQLNHNPFLTSLEGCPATVGKIFAAAHCALTSLEGGPVHAGAYIVDHNQLTSLKGAPVEVDERFNCDHNELTSLEGAPKTVGGAVLATDNKLTSLKDVHKHIHFIGEYLDVRSNPIKSHVLGVLLIKGMTRVFLSNIPVQQILNKHLQHGRDVMECQEELLANNLDEYAQL